ncbi:hypothetical protein JKP88DRAFT_316786 [Tribonema minus]|uniref:Uncharacterized protein n=1 Tax=Tribonema minus TaxID=303371 RepID=A0A835YXR7_9STRA|nr:hypothetical protein JKP88DRAFT_316786 [Tribonema minus]
MGGSGYSSTAARDAAAAAAAAEAAAQEASTCAPLSHGAQLEAENTAPDSLDGASSGSGATHISFDQGTDSRSIDGLTRSNSSGISGGAGYQCESSCGPAVLAAGVAAAAAATAAAAAADASFMEEPGTPTHKTASASTAPQQDRAAALEAQAQLLRADTRLMELQMRMRHLRLRQLHALQKAAAVLSQRPLLKPTSTMQLRIISAITHMPLFRKRPTGARKRCGGSNGSNASEDRRAAQRDAGAAPAAELNDAAFGAAAGSKAGAIATAVRAAQAQVAPSDHMGIADVADDSYKEGQDCDGGSCTPVPP